MPFEILAGAATNFAGDRGTQMAASISYYTLFSMFPATLLLISIFGIVIRDEALQTRVVDAIVDFLPIEGGAVESSLRNVADLGPTLTIVSFLGTAWAAAALSASIRSALNVAFEANRRRPFLRGKLIDYTLLPIISLPLLGGVVISAVVRLAREELLEWAPVLDALFGFAWDAASYGIPLLLSFTAFLLIYWLLPNRSLRFRYLWPGALLAAVGFEVLKLGFTFYLANFGTYDVVYGSVGSVIILLFWVFITANILIFGGEVAAEVPFVLHSERGTEDDPGRADWKRSLWRVVLGLVMVVDDEEAREHRHRGAGYGDETEIATATEHPDLPALPPDVITPPPPAVDGHPSPDGERDNADGAPAAEDEEAAARQGRR